MRNRIGIATAMSLMLVMTAPIASADVQPGQSMTHMKTAPGLAATLESVGVIFYVQGGATAGVMGDSISAPNSQVVFHIPVTGTKGGVQHVGSNIVFFNTTSNSQVQLRNPVMDLSKGVVTATIPQADNQSLVVLNITNAADLRPKNSNDRKAGIRSKSYAGANLVLAPGVAGTLATLLRLPTGSIAEGATFGTAEVTLKRALKKS